MKQYARAMYSRAVGRDVDNSAKVGRHVLQLLDLPLDLLLCILDWLDLSDIVSLSLCTRKSKTAFGNPALRALQLGDEKAIRNRTDLMCRLARDSGKLFCCFSCSLLQASAGVPPPGPLFQPPSCLNCVQGSGKLSLNPASCFATHEHEFWYLFRFQHVQLAMARHHRGVGHGCSLDALVMTAVESKSDLTTLLSVEPAIIQNELYLRLQQWVLFPPSVDLWSKIIDYTSLAVCNHIDSRLKKTWPHDPYRHQPMFKLLNCKLNHASHAVENCPTCHRLLACTECGVEFEIQQVDIYEDGPYGMMISKWINFGRGETPEDPRWDSKLYRSFGNLLPYTGTGANVMVKADEENGVSGRFERTYRGKKTLEMLTLQNKTLLRDESYRTEFKVLRSNWWSQLGWIQQVDPTEVKESTARRKLKRVANSRIGKAVLSASRS